MALMPYVGSYQTVQHLVEIVRFSYEKMDAAWNFINKIWNASRFVIMNSEGMTVEDITLTGEKTVADRWILTRLNETIAKVTELFDHFEFGEAGRQLYNFIWDDFCDWYIEIRVKKSCMVMMLSQNKQHKVFWCIR